MGKPADASLRLRCVACHSTETPLWRAGPDGPKTLCNACGVRYKKGKLVLYKDDDGKLTAVHRHNATPVHVPPAPKKPSKKAHSVSTPSSPADNGKKNAVRKVPSEGAIGAAVGKKPRSRSRRANAGQLPGRYASKTLPESLSSWRSPHNSRRGSPSSPVETPKFPEEHRSEPLLGMSCNPGPFAVEEPSIYQFTDPEDESIFPDMACLGLDCSADDHNLTLLPMPADPSSAEQFSFAFSGLDRDGGLEMDKPDRVEALRGLVLDRTRKIARTYETTVQALTSLCEQRYLRAKQSNSSIKVSTVEDCRNFVRAFAHEQSAGFSLEELGDLQGGLAEGLGFGEMSSGVMLSEKTAHSLAVESFKTLTDSTELAGFAEACMVELLAEDVVVALAQNGHTEFDRGSGCRVPESGLASKPIPTPA